MRSVICAVLNTGGIWGLGKGLTEAIEYIEEGDQHHGRDIDSIAPFSEIERAGGKVSTFGKDIGKERNRVRHRRQDDEGAGQIQECHRASKRNGAETRGDDSHEECRGHGARETLRDVGEEARERHGIVAGKSPIDTGVLFFSSTMVSFLNVLGPF